VGKTKFLRVPYFWDPKKLVNPHICVVGITGSGKSYFVKTFITRAGIVFGSGAVIIDWAGEYSEWVRSAGGTVLALGQDGINLLELAGASPHARIAQVMSALEILTDISSFPSQKSITIDALEKAYARRGFDLAKPGQKKTPPTLEDLVRTISGSSSKRNSDSREASRRIKSLLASSGSAFCKASIDLGSLVSKKLVCIDLHSLPTEQLRSLAGLAILQFIKEKMRASAYSSVRVPKLFVVADEAWKVAADERSEIVSIVREGRKYGFSLIIASQNPTDIHKSIFSCAGTVAAFRLTLASERDYLRSSLSYSDFFENESHGLSVGQALFHLEFSEQSSCPKNFLIGKIDGEEMLEIFRVIGGGMEISLEKGEMARRLLSQGLTERQASLILSEFERGNFTLEAGRFISLLEKTGQSRASAISLLREMGASERELLAVLSSATSGPAIAIELSREKPAKARGLSKTNRRRRRRG
jgi:hypothetical protein